jgi:hypothetical protein
LAALAQFFLESACVAWCCALLQVNFPCFLVVLSVDFLLPFGGNCVRQARARMAVRVKYDAETSSSS